MGRGSVLPIQAFTTTRGGGRGLHLLARNALSIQRENVFGNISSGRKTVFISMLVINSGHLQMNSKNGDYNAASEVLGQWVRAQHTDYACPAAPDIPLRKMQWRMMASACGWSTASSLLFTTARWCGFFAFKVSGRNIALAENMLANGRSGWERTASRWEKTGAGIEKRHGKGVALGAWEAFAKETVTPVLGTPRFRIAQGQSTSKLCKTCCVDIKWKQNVPFTLFLLNVYIYTTWKLELSFLYQCIYLCTWEDPYYLHFIDQKLYRRKCRAQSTTGLSGLLAGGPRSCSAPFSGQQWSWRVAFSAG